MNTSLESWKTTEPTPSMRDLSVSAPRPTMPFISLPSLNPAGSGSRAVQIRLPIEVAQANTPKPVTSDAVPSTRKNHPIRVAVVADYQKNVRGIYKQHHINNWNAA